MRPTARSTTVPSVRGPCHCWRQLPGTNRSSSPSTICSGSTVVSARALGFAIRRGLNRAHRAPRDGAVRRGEDGDIGVADPLLDRHVERLSASAHSAWERIQRLLADRLGSQTAAYPVLVRLHEDALGNPFFACRSWHGDRGHRLTPWAWATPAGTRRPARGPRAAGAPVPETGSRGAPPRVAAGEPERGHAGAGVRRRLGPARSIAGSTAGIIEVVGGRVRFADPLLAAAVAGMASDRERRLRTRGGQGGRRREEGSRAPPRGRPATGPDETVVASLEERRATRRKGAHPTRPPSWLSWHEL